MLDGDNAVDSAMSASERTTWRPERVALLLGAPAFLAALLALGELGEQTLNGEIWRGISETPIGQAFGWLEAVLGFVLAPVGLLALLIYALAQTCGLIGRPSDRRSSYAAWLVFACGVGAYATFWATVGRAMLSF